MQFVRLSHSHITSTSTSLTKRAKGIMGKLSHQSEATETIHILKLEDGGCIFRRIYYNKGISSSKISNQIKNVAKLPHISFCARRPVQNPLHVLCSGSSALNFGKTYVIKGDCIPERHAIDVPIFVKVINTTRKCKKQQN